MKEAGNDHWLPPNTGATNLSGFTGLPGGVWANSFVDSGYFGYWWSTSESDSNSWFLGLSNYVDYSFKNEIDQFVGMSARCIKD
jgi:uncharacterized protein (TIGR02145 family)